jgi:hypothetical protein
MGNHIHTTFPLVVSMSRDRSQGPPIERTGILDMSPSDSACFALATEEPLAIWSDAKRA